MIVQPSDDVCQCPRCGRMHRYLANPPPGMFATPMPCPLCGCPDSEFSIDNGGKHWRSCRNCSMTARTEDWNRRSEGRDQDTIEVLVDTIEVLVESLGKMVRIVTEFHEFHDSRKKPCGEWGVECPIGMGEWISKEDRAVLIEARALASPADMEPKS